MPMPILRWIVVVHIILMAGTVSVADDDAKKAQLQKQRTVWQERAISNLRSLEEETRQFKVPFLAIALAEAGDSQRAKAVNNEFLPIDKRAQSLMLIAAEESYRGQLDQALATMRELPKTHRPTTLVLIACRQAQRGDIDKALSLFPQLKEQRLLDRVRDVVATAQVRAGDLDAARETAKLIEDDAKRIRAEQEIERAAAGQNDPLIKLTSGLLQEQLGAIRVIAGAEWQRDAISAIAAAQHQDASALNQHMQAALDGHQALPPEQQATMRLLLSVALVEAGRVEQARKMLDAARTSNGAGFGGLKSLFGKPVVVYLLIRLDLEDEVQVILDDEENATSVLQAVGRTYAELDRLEQAEAWNDKLKSPADRFDFAVGVLSGLGN